MPLSLYRRHFRTPGKCLGGFGPEFRNYETDELRRDKRKNTNQTSWPDAKAVVSAWEAAGRWQDRTAPPALTQPASEPSGIDLSQAKRRKRYQRTEQNISISSRFCLPDSEYTDGV